MIRFAIILLCFYDFYVFDFLSFADVGLIILFIYLLKIPNFFDDKGKIFLQLFLLWTVVCAVLNFGSPHFSFGNFIKNLLRITFHTYFIISFIANSNSKNISYYFKYLQFGVLFICVGAFIEFLLLALFDTHVSFYIEGITLTNNEVVNQKRVSSFFNEPSYLGIFLGLFLLSTTLTKKINDVKIHKSIVLISIITIILTTSISGLFLLLIYIISEFDIKYIFNPLNVVGVVILAVGLFNFFDLIIKVDEKNNLIERVLAISEGEDGSFTHRILGSYELYDVFSKKQAIQGYGLGQLSNALDTYVNERNLIFHFRMTNLNKGSGVNNILLHIFILTGYIGLMLYLLVFISFFRKNLIILISFIAIFFSWGLFQNAYFIFMIAFLRLLILNNSQKQKIGFNT